MAGRFLFQKLSSGVSRSRRLPGAHASSAPALLNRRTASDDALGNFCNGAAAHPSPVARGYAARYFNIFRCSCTASKTSISTTGMSSVITHNMKPAFVESVRGGKRNFSSTLSTKNLVVDWEAQRAALEAELESNKAAFSEAELEDQKAAIAAEFAAVQAEAEATRKAYENELATWKAEADKDDAEFNLHVDAILCVFAALCVYAFLVLRNEASRRGKGHSPGVNVTANVAAQNPNGP